MHHDRIRFTCGRIAIAIALAVLLCWPTVSRAGVIPFNTVATSQYLLIGLGPQNTVVLQPGIGQAVNTNNFELGANKAPVPSTSDFLLNGNGGGPDLAGNVRDLPSNAAEVFSGIGGQGNIAITHLDGVYNLQDVGVYADPNIGIRTAGSKTNADAGTSNSFFNEPNMFPNTFDPVEFAQDGESGVLVNPNDADQTTRIDGPNYAGVHDNFDFTILLDELFGPLGAAATIPTLVATSTLDVSSGIGGGSQGVIKDTDFTVTLSSGLNMIDIDTGGGVDFSLDKSNLVIDGPDDAFAIFRVPDDANMLISNSNVLIGNSGIGMDSVLFFSDKQDNNQHFNFNNTVLNGIAFWSLGQQGGEIHIDNSQGCVQLVADKIDLNNVRFNRCAFGDLTGLGEPVPEPSSIVLLGVGAVFVLGVRWRKRRKRTA